MNFSWSAFVPSTLTILSQLVWISLALAVAARSTYAIMVHVRGGGSSEARDAVASGEVPDSREGSNARGDSV